MTEEDIINQIKEAKKGNALLLGSNREIRRLPTYLHENEEVYKIITGSPGRNKGRGIIVATNERMLFIKDGWVFRTVQYFPYDTISSVEFKTGIFFGMFVMYGNGDETAYNWVGRFAGAEFAKLIRKYSSDSNRAARTGSFPVQQSQIPFAQPTPISVPLTPQQTLMAQLRDLEQLRSEGIINLDEFEIKKQDLLSRM